MSKSAKATSDEMDAQEASTASLAVYIAQMAGELATMADRSDLTMLAYFLNLARVEAETKSRERAADSRGRA